MKKLATLLLLSTLSAQASGLNDGIGRHNGLKSRCAIARVGSIPTSATNNYDKIILISGTTLDLASSYYVTQHLESQGYTVYEMSPLYGKRFDVKDIIVGATITVAVLLIQKRVAPRWKGWKIVNTSLGAVKTFTGIHNLRLR